MDYKNILFLGGGNMASAIISRMVRAGYPAYRISVLDVNPGKLEALHADYGIVPVTNQETAFEGAEVILLAVKPQQLGELLAGVRDRIRDKLIISIAAGVPTANLIEMTGNQRVIRVMPNTPAKIGLGVTGVFVTPGAEDDAVYVKELFESCGEVVACENEEMIDSVTAVSGSGPAYVFLFMEAMKKAAESYGFSAKEAKDMTIMTVLGAANLAKNSDETLEKLRQNVTSKGGTTYEAIKVFEESGLIETVQKAMDACRKRAEELGRQFGK